MRPGGTTMRTALLSVLAAVAVTGVARAAEPAACPGSGLETWIGTQRAASVPGKVALLEASGFASPRCPCSWAKEEPLGGEACRCLEELPALRRALSAARPREKVVAAGDTGGQGFARLCAAPGRYVARLGGPGLRERLSMIEVTRDQVRPVELSAVADQPWAVEVRDPQGAKLVDARLLAFQGEPLVVVDLGRAGADGRWLVPAPLHPRSACFWVEAKGFAPLRTCDPLEKSGGRLQLGRATQVRATVQGPKGPVAGAEVLSLGRVVRRAVADARGVATFPEVPEGRTAFVAQRGELAGSAVAELRAGAAGDVAIAVAQKDRVAGRVVDSAGAPVAGATVTCSDWKRVRTKTDAAGAFACPAGAGKVHVGAEKEGFLGASESEAEGGALKLELAPAQRLTGRVVDDAGRPVMRAAVSVRLPRQETWFHGAQRPDGVAATNSAGRFAVDGLRAGEATVEVWHPRFRQTELQAKVPGAPMEVALATAPLIEVSVRTSDGPVTQGCVFMNENDGCLLADVDGVFRGALPEGAQRTSLVAHVADWVENPPQEVATAPGGQVTRAEIVLSQRTLAIEGRVVWKDGRPGRLVSLEAARVGAAEGEERAEEHASTDLDGLFTLRGLAPGRYVVRPSVEEAAGEVEVEAGARDVVLQLRRANCRWPHLRCLIEEKKEKAAQ